MTVSEAARWRCLPRRSTRCGMSGKALRPSSRPTSSRRTSRCSTSPT